MEKGVVVEVNDGKRMFLSTNMKYICCLRSKFTSVYIMIDYNKKGIPK